VGYVNLIRRSAKNKSNSKPF